MRGTTHKKGAGVPTTSSSTLLFDVHLKAGGKLHPEQGGVSPFFQRSTRVGEGGSAVGGQLSAVMALVLVLMF